MELDHSFSVSSLTREVCRRSVAARFRRHQCALLHFRCAQLDGCVLAWRLGPFREEVVTSLAMAELVRVLQRALWVVNEAVADLWLPHALARHCGESEISGVIQDLDSCIELIVSRITCQRMDSLRRKLLEDNFSLSGAADRDREDLLQQVASARTLIPHFYEAADHLLTKLQGGSSAPLRIRDFDKKKVIGSGASGKVFDASWFGHPVAVKCFRSHDPTYDRELEAMSKLVHPHPNILQMLGFLESEDGNCIVMELMKMDLRKFIGRWKDRQLPLLVAVDIMLQVARGARYLHDNDVVHRDLKPQNVLVDFDEEPEDQVFPGAVRIRLTDFGISRMGFNTHLVADDLTDMRGTMRYMAPEVMAMDAYSRKVDVYSFAVTCSEILTKTVPFGDDVIGLKELKGRVEAGQRPPLPEDCPQQLKELIQRCWSTDPEQRPTFVDIENSLASLKRLLLGVQGVCAAGICSSCSNSVSTGSSNSVMVPPTRTTYTDRLPGLVDFRFSRGSHDVGGKITVQFALVDGAKWAVCRWKREPRSGPEERTDPVTVSESSSLSYVVTALDYDKKVSLECLPMTEQMKMGTLVNRYIKEGDYIGFGNHLTETIERSWNNGQATFQVQHLHHKWWESSGKLIINRMDFLLWWGQSSTKNLRNTFGPEREAAPVELNEDDGALLCTIKGSDGSRRKIKFSDSASRDAAVLTLKYFWNRHQQQSLMGER